MARVISIPEDMRLKRALDYFSNQLPAKEIGWLELSGRVKGFSQYSTQALSEDVQAHLTHFVCTLAKTNRHAYGTIATHEGQIIYTGTIDDLICVDVKGRLSMMPQAPWSPPNEPDGISSPQIQRETLNLDKEQVSWSDLAHLSTQPEQVEPKQRSLPTSPTPSDRLSTDDLAVGDILMHPRFGRCKVVRAPSFGKIKIRKPNGAFSDLHLKVIQITRVEVIDNSRTIHVRIGKT